MKRLYRSATMHPITDDPLAWQGRWPRLPVHPPGAGLYYVWIWYELPAVANDPLY